MWRTVTCLPSRSKFTSLLMRVLDAQAIAPPSRSADETRCPARSVISASSPLGRPDAGLGSDPAIGLDAARTGELEHGLLAEPRAVQAGREHPPVVPLT